MIFEVTPAGVLIPTNDHAHRYARSRVGQDVDLVERGHSPREHRAAFDYLWWLYDQLRDQCPDRESFRAQVSLDVGHVKAHRVRLKPEYLDGLAKRSRDGAPVEILVPESWSHAAADRARFHDLMARVSVWGEAHAGVSFDEWLRKRDQYKEI